MEAFELVPKTGPSIPLDKDLILFGRDAGCDVVVNDASVSRRHAILERRPQGWLVLDQQSANGTFIDGQRVIQAYVRAGQELRLGSVAFTVAAREEDPHSTPTVVGTPAVPSSRPAPTAAAPAAAAPTSASGSAAPGAAEAAALLGVWPGARPEEILARYQKLRDDLTARITHAPTPSLKRMYQKNLQDLRTACEVLLPGGSHS
jgi:predicted component of type VI protein secretion system